MRLAEEREERVGKWGVAVISFSLSRYIPARLLRWALYSF
jgi:hypothetical protein